MQRHIAHACLPVCEAVGTDGTGRTVKLGQAAQAEETFEAGQHLWLPVILIPTFFVKSAGWGGGEAAGSQGNICSDAVSLAFSVLLLCPWLKQPVPGPAALRYRGSRPCATPSLSTGFISHPEHPPGARQAPATLPHPSRASLWPGHPAANPLQRVSHKK